jgi:methionine biosynthesis protein MetW
MGGNLLASNDVYNSIWEKKVKQEITWHSVGCSCRGCIAYRLLDGGNNFLDIGCGSGILAALLAKKYTTVYGVDFSPIALEKAKDRGIKTKMVNLNEDHLPFEDNYFDSVACLDVIEHVIDPRFLLPEINRVLRIGGTLVIAAPNIQYFLHLCSLVFLGRFPRTSSDLEAYDGGHIHYFTRKDLELLLITYGFSIIDSSFHRNNIFADFRRPGITIKAQKTAGLKMRF